MIRFILASASGARRQTLIDAGVVPEIIVSGVDESAVTAPNTFELVKELSLAKARAVAGHIKGQALVLGCDSLLDIDGEAFGKPASSAEASDRWRRMRGKAGTLYTGHALIRTAPSAGTIAVTRTVVEFGDPSDDEIDTYIGTGEPSNVAGGFTIDGFGGWFVESVTGDPHNVVGISLPTLRRILIEMGHSLTDIGYPSWDTG